MKNHHLKLSYCALAVSAQLFTTATSAQTTADTDKNVERMQVTGSHIRRTDAEGALPVTVLDRESIENAGFENLQQILERLPSAGAGNFSTRGNSQDSTANGAAAISLRGFGADSTLVLVNGRRIANNAFAEGLTNNFVDINSIPVSAIERVDILKDGASAIYGSDAIAGVVNIVLRRDFTGTELNLTHGATTGPDYDETNFSAIWGTGDDKGNTTLIFDYFKNSQLDNAELGRFGTANQAPYGGNDLRSSRGFPGRFVVDGKVERDPACSNPAAQCVYDYGPLSIAVPEAERVGMILNTFRDIGNDIELFAEFAAQHNISTAGGAATPLDRTAGLKVSASHPNNPWKKDVLIDRFRTVDAGPRRWDITSDSLRALVGVRGKTDKYDWEVSAAKSRSSASQTGDRSQGWVRTDYLQREIDAGRYNPFGGVSNPQSVIDAITTSLVRQGESHLSAADARISGELLELSSGTLGFAAGVEMRKEDGEDNPDDQFIRGLIFGTESVQAAASRNQKAAYLELSVPLTEQLEMQLAERYDHYSDFGSSSNPKVAFHYNATDSLKLRASWSEGFRAPSLAQIGLGPSQKSQFFTDEYRCPVNNPANPACATTDYTVVVTGNADLKPEESESWNVGLVWQASETLDFTVDYWNLSQDNKIDKEPIRQAMLERCGTQNNPKCLRLAPLQGETLGPLNRLFTQLINFSSQEASGIDVSANYKLDLQDLGQLKLNTEIAYLNNIERNNIDYTGEFKYPAYRWTTSADWKFNDTWSASTSVVYIGEFEDYATEDKVESTTSRTVDAYYTLDSKVNYQFNDQLQLSLGANNLLDEEPPLALGDGNADLFGYVMSMYNPRGRYVYAKVNYKF
jgi:iron complex outermembrane receptor protein